ncbi:uncharacterized protein [Watersipora subatra]|uniref:uncharacterized protein n=1 Tax=Watersipora subatra TaxID=2589382 RepID=UPI00355AF294
MVDVRPIIHCKGDSVAPIAGARVKCEKTVDAKTTDVVIKPSLDSVNDTAPGRTFGWPKAETLSSTLNDYELINITTQNDLVTASLDDQDKTKSSEDLTLIESTTNELADSFYDRSTTEETFMDISVIEMISDTWTSFPDETQTNLTFNDYELTDTTFESNLAAVSLEEQRETRGFRRIQKSSSDKESP